MNILAGAARAFTSVGRAAMSPFTFAFNTLKTGVNTLGKLAHGDVGGALKEAVGGTIKNAVSAGLDVAEGGMPLLAFAHGTVTGKVGILGK